MENQNTITFPLTVAVRTKEGWVRQVQYNNPLPIMETPGCIDAGVMANMLRGYVERDGDLQGMELMHFLNWAWNFNALPATAKEGAEVEVLIEMIN